MIRNYTLIIFFLCKIRFTNLHYSILSTFLKY